MAMKIFVRTADQHNDDAVLVQVGRSSVVAEVLQDAMPMLYSRDHAPAIPDVQLRVDGEEVPLRNRQVLGDLGLDLNNATFVVERKTGSVGTVRQESSSPPAHSFPRDVTVYTMQPHSVRRSSSKHRECYDSKAGNSIAALSVGQLEVDPPHQGRRLVNTSVRSTSCNLPNGMDGGMVPIQPSGTKRDDGLTLLQGGVHHPYDPQRYRRVHGNAAPHMQSSIGDWWGHRGGYPTNDKERGVGTRCPPQNNKKQVWQEGGEGLAGTWQHPVVPSKKAGHGSHPSKSDHIATYEGSMQPTNGIFNHMGKRQLQAQQSQLEGDLSPPPARPQGLKVTEKGGRRLAEPSEHISSHGHGLGPGLRSKMVSSLPFGPDSMPQSPTPEKAPRANNTHKSCVGGLMFSEQLPNPYDAPEESIEECIKRKGRAAAPSSFGVRPASPERLEAPPVPSENVEMLRKNLMDKVALYGGHGSKGEMQNAWRHICQGRQSLDKTKFCEVVSCELRVKMKPDDVELLLGYEAKVVAFKDFCSMCKPINESVVNNTPPPGLETRIEYGDRGIKTYTGRAQAHSPPFGIQGDKPPVHRSMRRMDMDLLEPVTLKDALMKIRELKRHVAEVEGHCQEQVDDMTDALNMMKKEHIEELKKVRAVAREREEVLMEQINPEKVRLQVMKEVREEAQVEIAKLREELTIASAKAASSAEVITALQDTLQQRMDDDEATTEQREAELAYLKTTILREQEESAALRKALERERDLLASEREEWKNSQAEAADALAECRQRAAKAELNARWVENIQKSLHAKDVGMKAAVAASELLLDLIESIRLTFGPMPVDAALNKALRTVPSVAKATSAGVDVVSLLGTGLRGFSETRAAANSRSSRSLSPQGDQEPVLPKTPERALSCTSPVPAQRDFLAQAKQLQMEAEALSVTRELESPRWSPAMVTTRPMTPSPLRERPVSPRERITKRNTSTSTSPMRVQVNRQQKPKQYAQLHQQHKDTWNWSSQCAAYPIFSDIPQAVYAAV